MNSQTQSGSKSCRGRQSIWMSSSQGSIQPCPITKHHKRLETSSSDSDMLSPPSLSGTMGSGSSPSTCSNEPCGSSSPIVKTSLYSMESTSLCTSHLLMQWFTTGSSTWTNPSENGPVQSITFPLTNLPNSGSSKSGTCTARSVVNPALTMSSKVQEASKGVVINHGDSKRHVDCLTKVNVSDKPQSANTDTFALDVDKTDMSKKIVVQRKSDEYKKRGQRLKWTRGRTK